MQSKKKYFKKSSPYFPVIHRERALINKAYDCFDCKLAKTRLVCVGHIKPTVYSKTYTIKLIYNPPRSPKVFIINPTIPYDEKAHMYKDGSLCLYYPKEFSWTTSNHIRDTIIPWIAEWLIFYELYLIQGKWQGPEQPHTDDKCN